MLFRHFFQQILGIPRQNNKGNFYFIGNKIVSFARNKLVYLLRTFHTKRLLIIKPAISPPITAQAAPMIEYLGIKIKQRTRVITKFKAAQGKNFLNLGEFWIIFPGRALRKNKTKLAPKRDKTGAAER